MRSRIATVMTALLLLAGTGGAVALGEGGSTGPAQAGAASGQYKPGKGCGKPGQHIRGGECKPKKQSVKAVVVHRRKHKASYHCVYRQIGRNLVSTCRYY